MSDPEEWPVVSESSWDGDDVSCPCGRTVELHWNGGELDDRLCPCGRFYKTEHRKVALVVREAPQGEMESRRGHQWHGSGSFLDGLTNQWLCRYCGQP